MTAPPWPWSIWWSPPPKATPNASWSTCPAASPGRSIPSTCSDACRRIASWATWTRRGSWPGASWSSGVAARRRVIATPRSGRARRRSRQAVPAYRTASVPESDPDDRHTNNGVHDRRRRAVDVDRATHFSGTRKRGRTDEPGIQDRHPPPRNRRPACVMVREHQGRSRLQGLRHARIDPMKALR